LTSPAGIIIPIFSYKAFAFSYADISSTNLIVFSGAFNSSPSAVPINISYAPFLIPG
jgi:hypothetical protein